MSEGDIRECGRCGDDYESEGMVFVHKKDVAAWTRMTDKWGNCCPDCREKVL